LSLIKSDDKVLELLLDWLAIMASKAIWPRAAIEVFRVFPAWRNLCHEVRVVRPCYVDHSRTRINNGILPIRTFDVGRAIRNSWKVQSPPCTLSCYLLVVCDSASVWLRVAVTELSHRLCWSYLEAQDRTFDSTLVVEIAHKVRTVSCTNRSKP
jgi:hypothetical protein